LEFGGSGTLFLLLTQRDVVKLFLVRLLACLTPGTVKDKAAALSKLAGAAIIWSERHAKGDRAKNQKGLTRSKTRKKHCGAACGSLKSSLKRLGLSDGLTVGM
jgi:hypothetical protein